jgi:hypothetical protein
MPKNVNDFIRDLQKSGNTSAKIYDITISFNRVVRNIKLLTTSAEQARISVCTEILPHMPWRENDFIVVKPLAGASDKGRWKYQHKTWVAYA